MRNQGTTRVALGVLSGVALWLMWRAWNLSPPELESIRMRYAIASALFGHTPALGDCVTVSDWRGLFPLSVLFSVLFAALSPLPRFLLLLAAVFGGAWIGLYFFQDLRVIVPLGGPAIMLTCAYICGSLIHLEAEKIERRRAAAIEAQLSAEAERKRIARDLHDACLGSISNVIRIADQLRAQESSAGSETPQQIRSNLEDAIMEIRRVINDLHPTILEEFGLIVALEHITEDFAKHTSLRASFSREGEFNFSKFDQLCLYRIVQEALANIQKHANATEVRITLEPHGAGASLTIEDDGGGGKIESRVGSFGLRNMEERAELIGGSINWSASQLFAHGTQVRIEVPLPESKPRRLFSAPLQKEIHATPNS